MLHESDAEEGNEAPHNQISEEGAM